MSEIPLTKKRLTPAIKTLNNGYEYLVGFTSFNVDQSEITVVDKGLKGWVGNTFVSTPYGTGFCNLP